MSFENYETIQEYVGFNYMNYIYAILNFLNSKEWETRDYKAPKFEGDSWKVIVSQYKLSETFTPEQIEKLRFVLKQGFVEGKRLVDIKKDILNEVQPGDLIMSNGAVLTEDVRSTVIARTEVVRATNQGLLQTYGEDGVEKVQWIASLGDRTCPYCDTMNGEIMTLEEADEQIPCHEQCRCTWAPVDTNGI